MPFKTIAGAGVVWKVVGMTQIVDVQGCTILNDTALPRDRADDHYRPHSVLADQLLGEGCVAIDVFTVGHENRWIVTPIHIIGRQINIDAARLV